MNPRIDAIGFVVSNMESTMAFYRMLGLELPERTQDGHVETTLPGGIRLMWDTIEVVTSFSSWEPPEGGHRMSLAFLCDSPNEVDTLYERVTAAGYRGHVEPFDAFWGQRYATVLDPDGNPVDMFARLEPVQEADTPSA